MNTLTDINRLAQTMVSISADNDTPKGHFTALTRVMGVPTLYLLRGEAESLDAPIVGRIEIYPEHNRSNVYKGFRMKGGRFLGINSNTRESLHLLVA